MEHVGEGGAHVPRRVTLFHHAPNHGAPSFHVFYHSSNPRQGQGELIAAPLSPIPEPVFDSLYWETVRLDRRNNGGLLACSSKEKKKVIEALGSVSSLLHLLGECPQLDWLNPYAGTSKLRQSL